MIERSVLESCGKVRWQRPPDRGDTAPVRQERAQAAPTSSRGCPRSLYSPAPEWPSNSLPLAVCLWKVWWPVHRAYEAGETRLCQGLQEVGVYVLPWGYFNISTADGAVLEPPRGEEPSHTTFPLRDAYFSRATREWWREEPPWPHSWCNEPPSLDGVCRHC